MFLENWRPLTRLNVDYKIIARALALRLKTKMDQLIHKDQTGFMQGRNIAQSLRTILDVIQVANSRSLDMIIVSMDWQKCFDRMTFQAIDSSLKYFNFGPVFRRYIQTMIRDTISCVTNNRHLSDFFINNVGAKQGSNISPPLWNLLAEVLADQIRSNDKIEGIRLGDIHHKLAQFADDTNAFLKFDRVTILEFEQTLIHFEETTGLQINYDKTCLYRIGSLAHSDAKIITTKPFVWTNGPIRILGLTIDHDLKNMFDANVNDLLDKTAKRCQQWHYRGLSLMGKVLVLNSLCASLFVYRLTALRFN